MTEIIYNDHLDRLNVNELVGFMSCFTNVSVSDDFKKFNIENKM